MVVKPSGSSSVATLTPSCGASNFPQINAEKKRNAPAA